MYLITHCSQISNGALRLFLLQEFLVQQVYHLRILHVILLLITSFLGQINNGLPLASWKVYVQLVLFGIELESSLAGITRGWLHISSPSLLRFHLGLHSFLHGIKWELIVRYHRLLRHSRILVAASKLWHCPKQLGIAFARERSDELQLLQLYVCDLRSSL